MGIASEPPTHLQVAPTEIVLKPGETVKLHARLYDALGRRLPYQKVSWALEQLEGVVDGTGGYTAPIGGPVQAGSVKASLGTLMGSARLRVLPPLPWSVDFESFAPDSVPAHWINAAFKY